MNITTIRRSALPGLVFAVAAVLGGLVVSAGPATAKHCQRCEDKHAGVGTASMSGDVSRGQFALAG
jgi:hypothetical protein